MQKGEASPKRATPPSRRTTEPIPLKFVTRIPEVLCYSPIKTESSRDSQPRAISTGSDLGRSPYELVGQARNKS